MHHLMTSARQNSPKLGSHSFAEREGGKSRSWHFRPRSFSISPLSSKYILYLIQLELITVRITLLLRAVFKLSASTSC